MNSLYDIVESKKIFTYNISENASIFVIPTTEKKEWHSFVSEISGDVYFLPEYISCYDNYSDGLGVGIGIRIGENSYFEQFRVKKINILGYETYCDLASEYGYGGPIMSITDDSFRFEVLKILNEFFLKHKVVSMFVRYHPLLNNANLCVGLREVKHQSNTITMQTNRSFDDILMDLSLKCRSNYRRAIKRGTTVRRGDVKDISIFYKMYKDTMLKVDASDFYMLSEDFFKRSFELLKDNSFFLIAEYENIPVAGAFFIYSSKYMHYHFSGKNLDDASYAKANGISVILLEAAKIASEMGIEELHLGGGVGGTNSDSLFDFKSNFSKKITDFHISRDIINSDIYNELSIRCDSKSNSFFPVYRNA